MTLARRIYSYPRDLPAPCATCDHTRGAHRSFADHAIRPSDFDHVCDVCLAQRPDYPDDAYHAYTPA
ncbi:MAG: hypothetical protein E6G45_14475 [Actinobacteria bacterium]|nr:MAG: hypothetical protein E6G45_14475 [Actinomycetota bacterium]